MDGVFPATDQYGQQLGGDRGYKANSPICGGWRGDDSNRGLGIGKRDP